jgi:hypothetical protein
VGPSFNEQFDQHGAWRREFALRLKLLSEWMKDHELLDSAVEERLRRLEQQMRSDKVMVAFVAEFSRGKSELINAIFFAGYKRRIMPASAGRTTMCPTELGYDAEVPPCLRLLPIETRLQPQALMEWRMVPEKWTRVDLDVNDPGQLAKALEMVAEIRRVSKDEARALGFWHDEVPEDNPMVDADGLVEVPKWRHALINIAHPLLKQGLVILDTPGLNAIGAEPELTVNLIPQAHAVVFILAADTGVTKSDLAIWREHLITESTNTDSRLVVLNKIDTMWDALSTPAQVQAQIDRQRATSAEILGLPREQVIPVSAQKGLVAKVNDDEALLQASQLPVLERALGQGVMGQRQKILRSAVAGGIADLRVEAGRALNIRRRDLAEQMLELKGLRGKNTSVIKHMRSRIEQEQVDFDVSGAKIHAVRSVHLKLLARPPRPALAGHARPLPRVAVGDHAAADPGGTVLATTPASCSAFPPCRRWPPPRWTRCWRCGAAWATTAARATCTAARRRWWPSTAASFPRRARRWQRCRASAAPPPRPLRPSALASGGHPRRQRQAGAGTRALGFAGDLARPAGRTGLWALARRCCRPAPTASRPTPRA